MRHPWTESHTCPAAGEYRRELRERQEQEARTLASLTGWNLEEIRGKMRLEAKGGGAPKWWQGIWKGAGALSAHFHF